MIDSHIHLSYRDYDRTFTYIDYDEDAVKILRRNRKKLHGGVCHWGLMQEA